MLPVGSSHQGLHHTVSRTVAITGGDPVSRRLNGWHESGGAAQEMLSSRGQAARGCAQAPPRAMAPARGDWATEGFISLCVSFSVINTIEK